MKQKTVSNEKVTELVNQREKVKQTSEISQNLPDFQKSGLDPESLAEGSIRAKIDSLISQEHMDIDLLKTDIDTVNEIIKFLDEEILKLRNLIKPISRVNPNRILLDVAKRLITPEDRRMYKIKIGLLRNEKIYARNVLNILKPKFRKLFDAKRDDIRLKSVRTRAQSRTYLRQNRSKITSRLSKIFKKAEKTSKNQFNDLKNAADSNTKVGKQKFNQLLSNFLTLNDRELYVICSGITEIKEEIFEEVRNILTNPDDSNPKKNSLTSPVLEGN